MRAICLWTVNPRWRDYADITLLSAAHDVAGAELAASIQIVAAYRNVALSPLDEALAGYVEIAQGKWSAFGAGGGWRAARVPFTAHLSCCQVAGSRPGTGP